MQSYEDLIAILPIGNDIIIARDGQEVSIAGNGFVVVLIPLQLLHQRCGRRSGVNLHFEAQIEDVFQSILIQM
jgi:anthraniloyl-CoA monooxygenase